MNKLQTDDSWRAAWAKDIHATPLTEDGSVPCTPDEFIEACRRKNRWCCGVTLQMISLLKRINILVWELRDEKWFRSGLILAEGQPSVHKTVVLVLSGGHYRFLQTTDIPDCWLGQGGRGGMTPGYFTRGGMDLNLTDFKCWGHHWLLVLSSWFIFFFEGWSAVFRFFIEFWRRAFGSRCSFAVREVLSHFELVDLGGQGDCGLRCICYALALKFGSLNELQERRIRGNIRDEALNLRCRIVHELLQDDGWRSAWCFDDEATIVTEAGPVPLTPDQFVLACGREHRWSCGVTLQAAANVIGCNILVLHEVADTLSKAGLICCRG